MEKKRHIKNFWYEWLINFIPDNITSLPGLLLENIGGKIGKNFQKCRRNIGKYIQKNKSNIGKC